MSPSQGEDSESDSRRPLTGMVGEKLLTLFNQISDQADKMVLENVDRGDLTGNVDFFAVYAQSDEEFDELHADLAKNGRPYDNQPAGWYYWLQQPLKTSIGVFTRCRIRKPDKEHPEKGYSDYEVKDYKSFKEKYLGKKNFTSIDNFKGEEMLELKDPKYNVRVYFISGM